MLITAREMAAAAPPDAEVMSSAVFFAEASNVGFFILPEPGKFTPPFTVRTYQDPHVCFFRCVGFSVNFAVI